MSGSAGRPDVAKETGGCHSGVGSSLGRLLLSVRLVNAHTVKAIIYQLNQKVLSKNTVNVC